MSTRDKLGSVEMVNTSLRWCSLENGSLADMVTCPGHYWKPELQDKIDPLSNY